MPLEFEQENMGLSSTRSLMREKDEHEGLAGLMVRRGWAKNRHAADVFLMLLTLIIIAVSIGIYFGSGRKNPGTRYREGIPVEDLRHMSKEFQARYASLPTSN